MQYNFEKTDKLFELLGKQFDPSYSLSRMDLFYSSLLNSDEKFKRMWRRENGIDRILEDQNMEFEELLTIGKPEYTIKYFGYIESGLKNLNSLIPDKNDFFNEIREKEEERETAWPRGHSPNPKIVTENYVNFLYEVRKEIIKKIQNELDLLQACLRPDGKENESKVDKISIKLGAAYNYTAKKKKLFKALQDNGFITNGNEEDFLAIFNGGDASSLTWHKEEREYRNKKIGGYSEVIFLLLLLFMLTYSDPNQFEGSKINSKLLSNLAKKYFQIAGEKELPTSLPTIKSRCASYISGKLAEEDASSKGVPGTRQDLIALVKAAFELDFDIPLKK